MTTNGIDVRKALTVLALLALVASGRPEAQSAAVDRFKVASIKPNTSPLSMITATMVLTNMTNRFVVDRTGLTGNYDVDLQWTPQGMRMTRPAPSGVEGPPGDNPPGPAFPAPPPDANGATLETAIQEQLGLKLDPQRGPVPVLMIDRAERPSSN